MTMRIAQHPFAGPSVRCILALNCSPSGLPEFPIIANGGTALALPAGTLTRPSKRCGLAVAGRAGMLFRSSIGAIALMAMLLTTVGGARAFDDAQYPNLKGQWLRARPPAGVTGQGPFDPDKSWGAGQQGPLTPGYQARLQ